MATPHLGRRPYLIVSADLVNRVLSDITLVRVTAVERDRVLQTTVALAAGEVEGLPDRSFVLCHELYTVPKSALIERLGRLSPFRMTEVERALGAALDLELAA